MESHLIQFYTLGSFLVANLESFSVLSTELTKLWCFWCM